MTLNSLLPYILATGLVCLLSVTPSYAQIPVRQVDVAAFVNDQSLADVNDAATLILSGRAGFCAQITGTHDMTLNFETTADGGDTWVAHNMFPSNSTTAATSTSGGTNGIWCGSGAVERFRVRVSADTSGTAVVDLYATMANTGTGGGGGGDASAANQTTIITSVQLLDDVVYTTGTSTYTEATSKGALINCVRNDTLAALADTDNEMAPCQVDASGAIYITLNSEVVDVTGSAVTSTADTELPAAAAIADNFANPTTSSVMSMLMCWDSAGGNWDRCVTGDYAEDAAHTTGDTGPAMMAIRDDAPPAATSGTAGDYELIHTNAFGAVWTEDHLCGSSEVTSAAINTTASGNVEIVALAANQTIFVCGWFATISAAETFQWIYGTGSACATGETDLSGEIGPAANSGGSVSNGGAVQFKTDPGEALCVEKSGTANLDGYVSYIQRDITP